MFQRLLRLQPVNNVFLFVASYLPDIVDKTIAIVFSISGRGYFHSVTVMAVSYALTYKIISKVRPEFRQFIHLAALYYALHLIFDFPELIVLFWPFLGPLQQSGHFSLLERLYNYYVLWKYPFVLSSEVIFFTILIIIKTKDNRAAAMNYHKTH
ncbi:MAG: hypothetical protein HQL00_06535 [Nitrospirae bacterium]|nr:metal-dependent hydrolase [Candidatus Magnetominusculus xianensis]MBF0403604.1 hypothetical protein [Nitrospirota bacterium]